MTTDSLQGGYKEVEQGTKQIETTGQTFQCMKEAITDVVNSISQINCLQSISTCTF